MTYLRREEILVAVSVGFSAELRSDWCTIIQSGRILVRKKRRMRCADDQIRVALVLLFGDDNTQLLSWGSIRIPKEGEKVSSLDTYRQMSTENLWRRYRDEDRNYDSDGKLILGRTLFISVVNTLDRAEGKKTCVDYMLSGLL